MRQELIQQPAIVREDESHRLERAVVEACTAVTRSQAELMKALYDFREAKAYERLGFGSFREWADSDRFPWEGSTGNQLTRIYRTFVVEGKADPEAVAQAGWSKLHRLENVTRRGLVKPADAVAMANEQTQIQLGETAAEIRQGAKAPAHKLPMWDVKIKLTGTILLHRRVRERTRQRAIDYARSAYGKEDLFGVRLGEATAKEIDER